MDSIDLENKTILVTGSAGFIGSNLVKRLFKDLKSATIVGIDNMNDYYDVALKEYRLKELDRVKPEGIAYHYIKGDIASKETIDGLFDAYKPQALANGRHDRKNKAVWWLSSVMTATSTKWQKR